MKQNTNYKNEIIICLTIGICFLWVGCSYLSWLYHLMDIAPNWNADFLSEVIGYLFQAAGMGIFAFTVWKKPAILQNRIIMNGIFLSNMVCMIPAILLKNPIAVLIFGYLMNLLLGLVCGIYLTYMVQFVLQQHRGLVFGIGYAFGSTGSWVLSLLGSDNFLKSPYALIIYFILILLSLWILPVKSFANGTGIIKDGEISSALGINFEGHSRKEEYSRLIPLSCLLVFALSAVKGLGFYFPTADLSSGNISLEFSRLFYGIGLIIAGFINDHRRKWGLIACIMSLIFPFLMMFSVNEINGSLLLWAFSYFFTGFYAVYRILLLSDFAKETNLLYLAGFGLLFGRIGDAAGSALGIFLQAEHLHLLLCISACLFLLTIPLAIYTYEKLYLWKANADLMKYILVPQQSIKAESISAGNLAENVATKTFADNQTENNTDNAQRSSNKETDQELMAKYHFSKRENEVFLLALTNKTNNEIANELYISENTIKFHIRNILKKTECANRNELRNLFRN